MIEQNSEITIDTDVLKDRTQTYSSLTDKNGVPVFTKDYQEKLATYQERVNQPYQWIQQEIFLKTASTSEDQYEQVKSILFTGSERTVVKEERVKTASTSMISIVVVTVFLVIVLLALLQYISRKRRKWQKYDIDIYAYEQRNQTQS